jgi:hypothetical protein
MDPSRIHRAVERGEIIDTLIAFSRAIDTRDWDGCRAILDDTVIDDHGTPEVLSRDAAIERWRLQVTALDVIQHVNTNYGVVVNGDVAKVRSEFITTVLAEGAPSGDLCTHGGSCDYDLRHTDAGWKLIGFKAVIKWSLGNVDLFKEAAARAPKP